MLNLQSAKETLIPLCQQGKLILFAGSGISAAAPASLPTWESLLIEFVKFLKEVYSPSHGSFASSPSFQQLLRDSENMAGKSPTRVASALKNALYEFEGTSLGNLYNRFTTRMRQQLVRGRPNEYHSVIVKTNYPYILTTNYDELLEEAAFSEKYMNLYLNSLTFEQAPDLARVIYGREPAIVHIHGKLDNITLDNFIFTSDDYIRIRKKYPGFTIALQTLFTQNSCLFVGYGASDPNIESLIEELAYFLHREDNENFSRYFLVLRKDKVDTVLSRHKKQFSTQIIGVEHHNETLELLAELQRECPRVAADT